MDENESQKKLIEDLLSKSDDDLIRWTVSGSNPQGYVAELGKLVYEMRCAKKNLESTAKMVRVTWAIAFITLITQIGLILISLCKK